MDSKVCCTTSDSSCKLYLIIKHFSVSRDFVPKPILEEIGYCFGKDPLNTRHRIAVEIALPSARNDIVGRIALPCPLLQAFDLCDVIVRLSPSRRVDAGARSYKPLAFVTSLRGAQATKQSLADFMCCWTISCNLTLIFLGLIIKHALD